MFEKIHMTRFSTKDILTPESSLDSTPLPETLDIHKPNSAFRSDFAITGDIALLLPSPGQNMLPPPFMYIQSFVLLNCTEKYYTRRQDYASYLLSYTYEGEGLLEYEGHLWELNPGDVFWIDCRKPHYYRTKKEFWKHGDLHFDGQIANSLYDVFHKNSLIKLPLHHKDTYQSYLEHLLLTFSSPIVLRDYHVSNQLENLLLFLMENAAVPGKNEPPENIRYLMHYMENNFQNNLTLDQLARFSGISKFHLCREFKKYTGFSPNEYIIDLRITRAKALLLNTDVPAYKIGRLVGIENTNHFINLFKQHTGTTPGEFRKRSRG